MPCQCALLHYAQDSASKSSEHQEKQHGNWWYGMCMSPLSIEKKQLPTNEEQD